MIEIKNIFSHIPGQSMPDELFEEILSTDHLEIERIVSDSHSSPKNFWYDQETDEWVILLQGSAGLCFEGEDEIIFLKPGDYLHIPAHTRHRVAWTDSEQKTIWLAVHFKIDN